MSFVRILSCGSNQENCRICIVERVIGFRNQFHLGGTGDTIYLVVRMDGKNYCCARGVLGEITDYKPWPDAVNYKNAYRFRTLECCEPFEVLPVIHRAGISNAGLVLQSPKPVRNQLLVETLDECFCQSILPEGQRSRMLFPGTEADEDDGPREEDDTCYVLDDTAYRVTQFVSETDETWGLEKLVNQHFFELFPAFQRENNFLIADHRLFITAGTRDQNHPEIAGIRGIPDALLITFEPDHPGAAFRINMIEYECNGTVYCTAAQKDGHLHTHVIPQMIRFASAFSANTEWDIRERTIQEWRDRIVEYIKQNPSLQEKVNGWLQRLHPQLGEFARGGQLLKELEQAFASNVKIILIMDELSSEKKAVISSLVKAFKLPSQARRDACVDFDAYVVQLIERDDLTNHCIRRSLCATQI